MNYNAESFLSIKEKNIKRVDSDCRGCKKSLTKALLKRSVRPISLTHCLKGSPYSLASCHLVRTGATVF